MSFLFILGCGVSKATDKELVMMRTDVKDSLQRLCSSASSGVCLAACSLVFLAALVGKPALAQTIPCADVRFLIEQSRTGFLAIQRDTRHEFGGFDTTIKLSEAEYCVILEDVEKRSFRCAWKYSHSDRQAEAKYTQMREDLAVCLGNSASVQKDQPVNHPDIYESYLYRLPAVELRISLKEKSALKSTFVSFVVEQRPAK